MDRKKNVLVLKLLIFLVVKQPKIYLAPSDDLSSVVRMKIVALLGENVVDMENMGHEDIDYCRQEARILEQKFICNQIRTNVGYVPLLP